MTPKKSDSIGKLSFEEAYQRLEQVISALEAGELDLDRSIALYEEGMQLAATCERKLDDAQLKVTKLLSGAEGAVTEAEAAVMLPDTAGDDGDPPKSSSGRQTSYLTFCS